MRAASLGRLGHGGGTGYDEDENHRPSAGDHGGHETRYHGNLGRNVKVAAFLGSPRKGGNTEILLENVLRGARQAGADVQLIRLAELSIEGCRNCGGCMKSGRCVVKDDMAGIYDAIRTSDRFVLASPIYFFSVSAQAKLMIDRCQAFWAEKYLLKRSLPAGPGGRAGLLLLVGAYTGKQDGVRCAEICAEGFFHSVSVPNFETLSFLGYDGAGEIRRHPTALDESFAAGRRLVVPATGMSGENVGIDRLE